MVTQRADRVAGIRSPDAVVTEVFNSDVYENWVNPNAMGNGGRIFVEPQPLHDFGHSASLLIPANSILVFTR